MAANSKSAKAKTAAVQANSAHASRLKNFQRPHKARTRGAGRKGREWAQH